jgi:hypothetical protein
MEGIKINTDKHSEMEAHYKCSQSTMWLKITWLWWLYHDPYSIRSKSSAKWFGAKQYESCYPHFSEDKHPTDNQIEKLTDSIKQAFIPIDPL